MAKIKWGQGIDYVSGLMGARPKKGQMHSDHTNVLLATHRVAATQSSDCNRIYLREAPKPRTNISSKELSARTRFTEVQALVSARAKDLNKISQDQADFAAQKDLAGGKRTMRAYLWKVCGAEYDGQ